MSEGVLNPQQLKLFMSGTELKNEITTSIDASMGTRGLEGLWPLKLRAAKKEWSPGTHGSGTYDSLKEKGWDSSDRNYGHVDMTHTSRPGAIPAWNKVDRYVDDAHHRIASAADIEAKSLTDKRRQKSGKPPVTHFIPVTHWQGSTSKPLSDQSTFDPYTGR